MKNVSAIKECFGCGVCAVACPVKIIDIRLNEGGFYSPFIDNPNRCTDCGICLEICAFNQAEKLPCKQEKIFGSYASWSKDKKTILETSSGGACYELGKIALDEGYKVIGVEYDLKREIANHYVASDIEELEKSKKSKYLPSYTPDGFGKITRKEKYMIISTPCHIDSIRRYIRKYKIEDNFVLIDFFCHGVPSMLLWKKYLEHIKSQTGEIRKISWRNKSHEWNESVQDELDWPNSPRMKVWGEKKNVQSKTLLKDIYFAFFLGNRCLAKVCYDDCRYKLLSSQADIRVGDFWGKAYQEEKKGISSLIAFTPKGDEWIRKLSGCCELVLHTPAETTDGHMIRGAKRAKSYSYVTKALKSDRKLSQIAFVAGFIDRRWLIFRAHRKIGPYLIRKAKAFLKK